MKRFLVPVVMLEDFREVIYEVIAETSYQAELLVTSTIKEKFAININGIKEYIVLNFNT